MTEQKITALAMMRQAFVKQHAPTHDPHARGAFEVDLDRLIFAIFGLAQEPFVRELNILRNAAAESGLASLGLPRQSKGR
jgi:hypothetical protein